MSKTNPMIRVILTDFLILCFCMICFTDEKIYALEMSDEIFDYKEIQEICINEYKESLDKITSAGILFAQSLQGEMKIFEDLKSNIERVSTDE